ncbi:hypothetical protein U9M48_020555 [Paspalum notatum var. saurae]|uniref:Uncharacterized protein n=1 Tax=Paspalum notatum var. saurae TaxID=547442 RepID=A0AAQ3WST6_PASNO
MHRRVLRLSCGNLRASSSYCPWFDVDQSVEFAEPPPEFFEQQQDNLEEGKAITWDNRASTRLGWGSLSSGEGESNRCSDDGGNKDYVQDYDEY